MELNNTERNVPIVAGDSALQAALDLRAVTSRLRRRMMTVTGDAVLPGGQAAVLMRIVRREATTASALATVEHVSPQSMAVTLAALQQRGYIERTQHPTDGRRQIVEATDAGRARVEDAQEVRHGWLETALAQECSEAERQTIIQAMAVVERLLH